MNIPEPELICVEDRYDRVNPSSNIPDANELLTYVEEEYKPECNAINDKFCNEGIEIVPYNGNCYKHSFHVNSHLIRFIIGPKGSTLNRLKAETNTQIYIPQFCEDKDVVITGYNKKDIIAVRHRIDLLIETSRSKVEFTHFLGIPVNSEDIKENVKKLKNDVLTTCAKEKQEILEEIFQYPEKLHITLHMLKLLDEEDCKKAADDLEICHKNIIMPFLKKSGPITIEFRGLKCMNKNQSKAKVLYIQPHDETGFLQQLADKIANYFHDQGYISRKTYCRLKLHMTVMKQRYSTSRLKSFDATDILKNHKNTYFGKMNLSTIHLSQRHTVRDDGYYQATAKIDLTVS